MITVCIVGLGYVGLPLALNISKKFKTIGFDTNDKRINNLKKHRDNNFEFKEKDFHNKKILFTNQINKISECTYYIICVPTPIDIRNKPELFALKKTFNILKKCNTSYLLFSGIYGLCEVVMMVVVAV